MDKMKIDIEQLEERAKIKLNDEQVKKLVAWISSVTDKLVSTNDTDTEVYENASDMHLREDTAIDSFDKEKLFKNTPKRDENYVVIPKTME